MQTNATTYKYAPLIGWVIWFTSLSFCLFQFILQLSSGVIVESLMTDFNLNAFGAGMLSSSYYYIYVLLQTPAGMLMDKYRPHLLLTGCAIMCSLATLLFSVSNNLIVAFMARLLMGTGGAFAFVGSVHLMRQWFAQDKFPILMGLTEAIGMLFSILGTIILAYFIGSSGWRHGMFVLGIIGVVIAVGSGFVIRENPAFVKPLSDNLHFTDRFKLVLKDPALFWNGLYCGILFAIVSVFAALWGIPFLQLLAHFNLPQATSAASMIFIGAGFGAPLVSYIYSRTHSYRMIMGIGGLLTTLVMLLLIWLPYTNQFQLFTLLLFCGVGCSLYILSFTFANEIAHPLAKSTAIGYTNSLCVITAPLFQPLIGYLMAEVSYFHTGVMNAEYTLIDYQVSLCLLPASIFVASVIALFLPEPSSRFVPDLQA